MRDSFVFYRSYFEAISDLDDATRLQIFDAIADYSLNGDEPELTGVAKMAFTLIKPNIDANQRKYENGKKGAEHGKKGGRPRKEKTPKKPLKNPTGVIDKNPKKTPNVDVDVDVDVDVECKMSNDNNEKNSNTAPEKKFDLYGAQKKPEDENTRIAKHIQKTAAEILQRHITINSPGIIECTVFKELLDDGFKPDYIGGIIEGLEKRFNNKPLTGRLTSWRYIDKAVRG